MPMLSDEALADLLQDLESEYVERKSSVTADVKKRIAQAICAFANDLPRHDRPGYILIGVDDKGRPTGLSVTDRLLLELAALRNAVLHRSYETNAPIRWYWFADRVEIHSPGGLFGRVHEHNFGEPYATDDRNPRLAEGLKVLNYVQRFGVGIALARRACLELSCPAPGFEFSSSAVLAVVRRAG